MDTSLEAGANTKQTVGLKVDEGRSIDWLALFTTVWGSRKLIAHFTGWATVVAIVVSLLLPKYFRATAVLLPESNQNKLGGLLGFAELASLGVGLGESSFEMLYPNVIRSEAVLKEIIYRKYETEEYKSPVNLIQYWEIDEGDESKNFEEALEKLRKELDITSERQTNIVSVSLLMKEAKLSADIVNGVIANLDEFLRTKQSSNASEQRRWIEGRLDQVKEDLKNSENKLKEFRAENRRVIDSPQLILEQERYSREVIINSTLYVELKKQLELAKIDEIKNIPIINVMDAARPTAKKEKPKRALIVIFSCLAGFMSSILYVIAAQSYRKDILSLRGIIRKVGT